MVCTYILASYLPRFALQTSEHVRRGFYRLITIFSEGFKVKNGWDRGDSRFSFVGVIIVYTWGGLHPYIDFLPAKYCSLNIRTRQEVAMELLQFSAEMLKEKMSWDRCDTRFLFVAVSLGHAWGGLHPYLGFLPGKVCASNIRRYPKGVHQMIAIFGWDFEREKGLRQRW